MKQERGRRFPQRILQRGGTTPTGVANADRTTKVFQPNSHGGRGFTAMPPTREMPPIFTLIIVDVDYCSPSLKKQSLDFHFPLATVKIIRAHIYPDTACSHKIAIAIHSCQCLLPKQAQATLTPAPPVQQKGVKRHIVFLGVWPLQGGGMTLPENFLVLCRSHRITSL